MTFEIDKLLELPLFKKKKKKKEQKKKTEDDLDGKKNIFSVKVDKTLYYEKRR